MSKLYKNLDVDFPIDMVYLWCDGNDPLFEARKIKYSKEYFINKEGDYNEAAGSQRFYDNDELRYSLRSLEQYVPWINHVYIITDGQIPRWLNLKNKKITIIDHSQIMPQELIPCFNSTVIERYMVFIPNLQEHFLYGNDDMFFGSPLGPEYFFDNNKPIVRVKFDEKQHLIKSEEMFFKAYNVKNIFQKSCLNSWALLYREYGQQYFYKTHHNIDAYTKKNFLGTLERYQSDFEANNERFRCARNIQRLIFSLDAVYSGNATMELIGKPSSLIKHLWPLTKVEFDDYCGSENKKTKKEIRRFHPKLFCINADRASSIEDKRRNRLFLEELFPQPSHFEK